MSINGFFSVLEKAVPGIFVFAAVIGGAMLLLWLILGRKKKGEDKMIGILKETSVFKGHFGNGDPRTR